MVLLRRHTRLRSSIALDYIEKKIPASYNPGEHVRLGYLLMTTVPGKTLRDAEQNLTADQITTIGLDLREYLTLVRGIPNPHKSGMCSAGGGSLDLPLFGENVEPPAFDDTASFHAWVWKRMRRHWPKMQSRLEPVFSKYDREQTVFSHGDLSADNIMIHNGRLSALIDWETAAWLPPYWEYATARWEHQDACRAIVKAAFPERYDIERQRMTIAAAITRGATPEDFEDAYDRYD